MPSDTFTERRGYVAKRSGFGGAIALLAAIGLVVAGAGVAGLRYASTHGLNQPVSTGQTATDVPTADTPTFTIPADPTSQVETTSASVVVEPPAPSASAAAAPAAAPAPPPQQQKAVRPWKKPTPTPTAAPTAAETSEPAGDTFSTQH